jgi:hypothetical protein
MAYDTALADRIRELIVDADYVEKRMFGGLAFLIGGHISVAASGQGGVLLRCEPEDTPRLRTRDGVAPFVMRGKQMDGWLRVEGESLADDETLAGWVEIGVAFALSLPPK